MQGVAGRNRTGLGGNRVGSLFLCFCNENPITHLQQDSASVESKIVINTFMCSSAQNTAYAFQAKPTYLYLMVQCINSILF